MRMLNQNSRPASLISELPLKLARKCVEALGIASYEEECGAQMVSISTDEEVASVCAGKDFGFIRTTNGKVNLNIYSQTHVSLFMCVYFIGFVQWKSSCVGYKTVRR